MYFADASYREAILAHCTLYNNHSTAKSHMLNNFLNMNTSCAVLITAHKVGKLMERVRGVYLAKSSPGKRARMWEIISGGTRSLLKKWESCSDVMGGGRFPFFCGVLIGVASTSTVYRMKRQLGKGEKKKGKEKKALCVIKT